MHILKKLFKKQKNNFISAISNPGKVVDSNFLISHVPDEGALKKESFLAKFVVAATLSLPALFRDLYFKTFYGRNLRIFVIS